MDIEKIREALSLYSHNINDNIILFKDQKTDKVWAAACGSYFFITQEYWNKILSNNDFYFNVVSIDDIYTFTTWYGYRVHITKKPDYAAIVYRETRQLNRALEIGDREQWVL